MISTDLKVSDSEIFNIIQSEFDRQKYGLEMIASENYTSKAVMQAQGSILTNKYAEGYPNKRYYGGCEFVDQAEQLAIDRAKQLFGAQFANVQAHSGSQANMAAYMAVVNPGDAIMGMDLSNGGHLTHGASVNFSGSLYKFSSYKIDPNTGRLNYDQIRDQALEAKPKLIIAGYSAYPRTLDFSAFRKIADEVGALLMVDMAHFAGLVAGGAHPNPVPFADIVTTTTHKTLRGPRGGMILTNNEEIAKKINSKIFPGIQGGPLEHVIAAKAVALGECLKPDFKVYAAAVVENARVLANALIEEGFNLVTGGTDNHLMLVDLSKSAAYQEVTGKLAETSLDAAGITVNKNTVPGEQRSPFVTSGIRIGTPALTTRGMGPSEMKQIARWISMVLKSAANKQDESLVVKQNSEIKNEIKSLCVKFPVYSEM